MTPWDHAISSAKKYGGTPGDYIDLHDWFDCTKMHTGNWTHRALRHHSQGIQEACESFGHAMKNSEGAWVPTKLLAEQHVTEDCGFVPTIAHWLEPLKRNPETWMLGVKVRSREIRMKIPDEQEMDNSKEEEFRDLSPEGSEVAGEI